MGEDEIEVEERLQVQTTEMTKEQDHHVLALLQRDQMPRQHLATPRRQRQSLKRKEEATMVREALVVGDQVVPQRQDQPECDEFYRVGDGSGSSRSIVLTARFSDPNVLDDAVEAGSREGANDDAT